ncbi:unnamed protein product, partial [Ectocarpus fasciculatus]
ERFPCPAGKRNNVQSQEKTVYQEPSNLYPADAMCEDVPILVNFRLLKPQSIDGYPANWVLLNMCLWIRPCDEIAVCRLEQLRLSPIPSLSILTTLSLSVVRYRSLPPTTSDCWARGHASGHHYLTIAAFN